MNGFQLALILIACAELLAGSRLWAMISDVSLLRAEARQERHRAAVRLQLIDNPQIPDELRAALEQLAEEISGIASSAVAFRGTLLADELRKTFALPDIVMSVMLYKALTAGMDVEKFAELEHRDAFGILVGVLSSAAAELSSLERELTR